MLTKTLAIFTGIAIVLVASAASVQAAIVVTVSDVNVGVGDSAWVDVFVESDQVGGESYAFAGYDFLITPVAPTASQLAFVNPQPNAYTTQANYLFFGDSLAPAGVTSTSTTPNDRYVDSGSTQDGGLTLYATPLTSQRLLVRLQVTTATGLPPSVGDSFDVTFNQDPNFSFITADIVGTPLAFDFANSKLFGRVNVVSAVPEPSSFALCSLLGLACFGYRSRQRSETVTFFGNPHAWPTGRSV